MQRIYLVVFLVGVFIAYQYHRKMQGRITRSPQRGGVTRSRSSSSTGLTRSTGSGARSATQFSSTGSSSPGSGVQVVQPNMTSTWGVGGGYGIGFTGPSYAVSPSTAQ